MQTETFQLDNGITMTSICSENEHNKRKAGTYEQEVLDWILDKDLDLFIDVGAFCGWFSLHAWFNGVTTIAFEPGNEPFEILKENFRRNIGLSNKRETITTDYEVINKALSNKNEETEAGIGGCGFIEWQDKSGIEKLGSESVETLKLDDFLGEKGYDLANRKTCLKIDVEGMELQVLQGAKEVLNYINYILLEFHPSYVSTKEISKTRGLLGRYSFEEVERWNGDPHTDNCNVAYKRQ